VRVLFTAHGAYGHVQPLIGVARALVSDGHDVLFATAADVGPLVASHGIDAVAAGMADEELVAAARRTWPEARSSPPATWTVRMFCEIAAPAVVQDLAPVIRRWRPDVIVREEGEHGGPLAAAVAGLPWVTHGWGSPLPAPESLVETGKLVAPAWARAGLRAPDGPAIYGAAVLDPCPPSLYAVQPPLQHRHVVRSWTPGAGMVVSQQRPHGRRLAYVGFGTVPLFRNPTEVLYVVVNSLLALDFDVTVTAGSDEVVNQLRAIDGNRVRAERWVDLPSLLQACDLVVCHGGAGTVLAALSAGLPVLLLPRGAPSQLRMSMACEARGVGRTVIWNRTSPAQLGDVLAELTSSSHARAAAAALASEVAGMPDPSTGIAVLRGAIAKWR